MNKKALKDIATSLTTLTFFVIGISGVMLYFHWFNNQIKQLHEILGLAFVAIVLLHIFVNWNSMKSYFKKSVFFFSTVLIFGISALFVVNNLGDTNNPKTLVMHSVFDASIEDSFKILHIDYAQAKEQLALKSVALEEYKTINEIAKKNGLKPLEIIVMLSKKN